MPSGGPTHFKHVRLEPIHLINQVGPGLAFYTCTSLHFSVFDLTSLPHPPLIPISLLSSLAVSHLLLLSLSHLLHLSLSLMQSLSLVTCLPLISSLSLLPTHPPSFASPLHSFEVEERRLGQNLLAFMTMEIRANLLVRVGPGQAADFLFLNPSPIQY